MHLYVYRKFGKGHTLPTILWLEVQRIFNRKKKRKGIFAARQELNLPLRRSATDAGL
jgi:hypothetical protein